VFFKVLPFLRRLHLPVSLFGKFFSETTVFNRSVLSLISFAFLAARLPDFADAFQ